MSLQSAKLVSLKQKLEEKAILEEAVEKVEEKIDKLVGEKEIKIKRKKK